MTIKDRIDQLHEELIALRRDFHMYPELGFQEFRTAEKVETYLHDLGLAPRRVAETGVTAALEGGKPGPVFLLRADMDALPVQEENNVPYASKTPGVMHACGHDAHTAMLLAAAKVLCGIREELPGTVKFVFQPNEEVAGAEIMVEQGVMEDPRPEAAMAVHIWTPLAAGLIGVQNGPVMAGLEVFKITVHGKGGHTGYPESAVDPIAAAAAIVQTVQTIQTREVSLMTPTVIMFGKIQGGMKSNIIPDEVVLEGTIRFLYEGGPGSKEDPVGRLKRIAESVADVHRCTCTIETERENYAVINHPSMVQLIHDTAVEILGDENKVVPHASMAGEDFSAFASRVPAAFVFLGTGNPAKKTDYPHHNPRFNIDEDVLPLGVELLVKGAVNYLEKHS